MKKRIGQYIRMYYMRNVGSSFIVALILVIACFIEAIVKNIEPKNMYFVLFPLIICVIVFLVSSLNIWRFVYMIKSQERMFDNSFDDKGVKQLSKIAFVYASDEWLFWVGHYAFCRKYIKSISHKSHRMLRGGCRDKVKIVGVDERVYRFWWPAVSEVKRIYVWYNGQSE